jgi:hypothetical protein
MELGAVCVDANDVETGGVHPTDKIIDSFKGTRGVVQVNQTSGDAIISKNYMSFTSSSMELH